jgi:hypothetical protein
LTGAIEQEGESHTLSKGEEDNRVEIGQSEVKLEEHRSGGTEMDRVTEVMTIVRHLLGLAK